MNTTHPDIIKEGNAVIREIMALPGVVAKIKSGMEVKEALLEELNAWASFVAKTDRSTEQGRALDNVAREVTFNHIWNKVHSLPA